MWDLLSLVSGIFGSPHVSTAFIGNPSHNSTLASQPKLSMVNKLSRGFKNGHSALSRKEGFRFITFPIIWCGVIFWKREKPGKLNRFFFQQPMLVIQCQVFRFQYSLAEPDIQFVKVVFAMRLEFGLNILVNRFNKAKKVTQYYITRKITWSVLTLVHNLSSSPFFSFLPFLITGIKNSWICLLRISLTLSGEMKTAATAKCNLNGTKLFQVSQEGGSAGWFLYLKHETQRNANCFSIVGGWEREASFFSSPASLRTRNKSFLFQFLDKSTRPPPVSHPADEISPYLWPFRTP